MAAVPACYFEGSPAGVDLFDGGAARGPSRASAGTGHRSQGSGQTQRGGAGGAAGAAGAAGARQPAKEADKEEEEEEEDSQKPLCVNGFELGRLLGQGSFGRVHLCRNLTTNLVACIKLESIETTVAQVLYEHRLYESLGKTPACKYVPKSLGFGQSGDYRFLIMTRGGKDLTSIIDSYRLDEKLLVFRNVVMGLRAFHRAGVVHRDIKPRNILVKLGCRTDILLIDLGLAKRYSLSGLHSTNCRKKSTVGTSRYASVHSQQFVQSSRRDDMYSCVYAMVSIFGKRLPWEGLKGDSKQKMRETLRRKRLLPPSVVCRGCPPSLVRIYQHVQQLRYDEEPPYELFLRLIDLDMPVSQIIHTTSSIMLPHST
jgi:serine/threonine protein kinase